MNVPAVLFSFLVAFYGPPIIAYLWRYLVKAIDCAETRP